MEFSWETLEHEYTEKSPDWFWVVGIGGAVIALASLLLGNILLSLVAILVTVVLFLYSSRQPEKVKVTVNRRGVQVEHIHHPFNSLRSFWIHDHLPKKKLILHSDKAFAQHWHLPIPDDVDHEALREFLLEHLKEEPHEPTLIDVLVEKI